MAKQFGSQLSKFMESTKQPAEDISKEFIEDTEPIIDDAVGQQATLKVARKRKEETKSKRVQLLVKPSVYAKSMKIAKKLGYKSFNDYINSILEQIIEG